MGHLVGDSNDAAVAAIHGENPVGQGVVGNSKRPSG